MSENSSDSDSSSCGWTVISHEGSDIEAVASEHEGPGSPLELDLEDTSSLLQENGLQEQPVDLQADFGQADASPVGDQGCCASETVQAVPEEEKEKLPEESSCVGAVSDDSDIVTLDTPKVEGIRSPEELATAEEDAEEEMHVLEDFNMGSSSSSQYTFCPPETVFPAQPSGEESSSDESSCRHTSPALRWRRPKKRAAFSSESEEAPPCEQDMGQGKDPSCKHPLSGGLNRCIILALVIAISMGFGHFYGTVQVQKQQQWVEKIQEDEWKEMKGHLVQCQQEHGRGKAECRSLKEGLAACLLTTEKEKKSFESQKDQLASENLRLRESLEKEEKALVLLQEELRKLQEELRQLESPEWPRVDTVASENQKLKVHLEEEKKKRQSFAQQKEVLLAEAQMLRRELDKERQLAGTLRDELDKLSAQQQQTAAAAEGFLEDPEMKALRERLAELEKKISFEQQRSDLWEKLYVEAKDQAEDEKNGQVEKGQRKEEEEKPLAGGRWGSGRGQTKPKATFLGSVKETFDAMKNSTKEFVRHHKEKIKQAKEAVKENLRKFSDSVKSTFSHFKDTTKNIFQERGKERHGSNWKREAKKKKGPVGAASQAGAAAHRAPGGSHKGFGHPRPGSRASPPLECPRGASCGGGKPHHQAAFKGCAGIFDCAHQEFASLFNKVLDPIRADEFNQLMHKYLQQQVDDFHHWRELELFVSHFFRNGVFIHDQMLFTDFVHDVQDYLGDMKEYQKRRRHSRGAFEGLDDYIYHYFFHYDPLPQHGPSSHPANKAPLTHTQRTQPDRLTLKPQPRAKKAGRWQHEGRSGGRQMARLEIKVGQMPFDPKY